MLWPLRRIPVDLAISHGNWNDTYVENGTLEQLQALPGVKVLGTLGNRHWVIFNPLVWSWNVNNFRYKGQYIMFLWHDTPDYLTFKDGQLATERFKKSSQKV